MKKTDVAVIGLSCVFPGAQDADTFWQNIINKVDSTQLAPADRIDPVHFSDAANPVDRFYCQRVDLFQIMNLIRRLLGFSR
ncbi:hypothetical protein BN1195_04425 [Chryseobacterium oranimense G311]|uniref:beta-ketoacyl synthase N-terminal-like domain-containing protein n=1 Tax=Chryseobacterium oranimense TaxID=421058 RepID=UPI0005338BEA|nr:beta-ketoacyl synthase N-terminal-like domain-containing protein [Chryseobacterium oranimense]CEJ72068.1 hypothetical protein BN1195_04425 [Chryseobacterium oranimense G311]